MDTTIFDHAVSELAKVVGADDNALACRGVEHALVVAEHIRNMAKSSEVALTDIELLCVLLSALLHGAADAADADDHMFFSKYQSRVLANAAGILATVLVGHKEKAKITEFVLYSVSIVSACKNGNRVPERARENPLLLWARHADRLVALDNGCLKRCRENTNRYGNPLYVRGTTPEPRSAREALDAASTERWEHYSAFGCGKSASMMDHIYDNLIHLGKPMIEHDNAYLVHTAVKKIFPVVELCMIPFGDELDAAIAAL